MSTSNSTSAPPTSTPPAGAPPANATKRANRAAPGDGLDPEQQAMPVGSLLTILVGALVGAAAALASLPALGQSLSGEEPKAFWHLSRSSGLVAYGLLWLSMALGVAMTNKLARVWPGGPTAFDLHQHTSILALAFTLFHALILLGDRYVVYTLPRLLVPFASVDYRPLWVGLGQVGLYLLALVALTFYVRSRIGHRLWRLIHFLSFAVYLLVLAHGLGAGTDGGTLWAQALYWGTGATLLYLSVYRILIAFARTARRPA